MDPREFETMLALDERHWWYRGRRRVLQAVLDSLAAELPPTPRILDAGCGSGRTLDDLARRGSAHGIELNPRGVEAARRRGQADVRAAPIERIPHEDAGFDLVTCLDVIEHTEDDVAGLRELRRVTKPQGHLVVTVPAHPRLWSRHDVLNGHRRRYTRRSLQQAARSAGWTVTRQTGFNVAYLLPAALVRLTTRDRTPGDQAEDETPAPSDLQLTPPSLDTALELPLRAEAALIARGLNLPPGLSLLAVLRKDDAHIPS